PSEAPGFAMLLADFVHRFAATPAELTDAAIGDAQVQICRALNLDCCALLRIGQGGDDLAETHSWTNPDLAATSAFSPKEEFPWAMREILAGQTIRLPNADTAAVADEDSTSHGPAPR